MTVNNPSDSPSSSFCTPQRPPKRSTPESAEHGYFRHIRSLLVKIRRKFLKTYPNFLFVPLSQPQTPASKNITKTKLYQYLSNVISPRSQRKRKSSRSSPPKCNIPTPKLLRTSSQQDPENEAQEAGESSVLPVLTKSITKNIHSSSISESSSHTIDSELNPEEIVSHKRLKYRSEPRSPIVHLNISLSHSSAHHDDSMTNDDSHFTHDSQTSTDNDRHLSSLSLLSRDKFLRKNTSFLPRSLYTSSPSSPSLSSNNDEDDEQQCDPLALPSPKLTPVPSSLAIKSRRRARRRQAQSNSPNKTSNVAPVDFYLPYASLNDTNSSCDAQLAHNRDILKEFELEMKITCIFSSSTSSPSSNSNTITSLVSTPSVRTSHRSSLSTKPQDPLIASLKLKRRKMRREHNLSRDADSSDDIDVTSPVFDPFTPQSMDSQHQCRSFHIYPI